MTFLHEPKHFSPSKSVLPQCDPIRERFPGGVPECERHANSSTTFLFIL